jgi:hypothetical protein
LDKRERGDGEQVTTVTFEEVELVIKGDTDEEKAAALVSEMLRAWLAA